MLEMIWNSAVVVIAIAWFLGGLLVPFLVPLICVLWVRKFIRNTVKEGVREGLKAPEDDEVEDFAETI